MDLIDESYKYFPCQYNLEILYIYMINIYIIYIYIYD